MTYGAKGAIAFREYREGELDERGGDHGSKMGTPRRRDSHWVCDCQGWGDVDQGHNRRVQHKSAIHHGEMNALEMIGRKPASFYVDTILYTTLSPCSMCTGAILLYKIPHVIIGENKTFQGEEELLRTRGVAIKVIDDPECIQLMTDFIQARPKLWFEDIGVD